MVTIIENEPADFLPSNRTIALFSNVSEETLRKFETIFPQLGEVEPKPSSTIALLKAEDQIHIAEFLSATGNEDVNALILGRFAVVTSNNLARDLLKTSTPRLSSINSYNSLVAQRKPTDTWVFLDISALPQSKTITQELVSAAIPKGSTHAAITFEDDLTQLAFAPVNIVPKQGLSPSIKSSLSDAIATIRFANASHAIEKMLTETDDTTRSFVEGALRQLVEDAFGPNISFQFDILPLFEGPTSLHLGLNESGTLLVAIEGVAHSSKDLDDRLEVLYEGFKTTLPTTRVTQRTFDKRFSAQDIRTDDSLISEETTKHENWVINSLESEDEKRFFTARRSATFVLSNDEDALMQILERSANITLPTSPSITSSIRISDGIIKTQELMAILEDEFPILTEGSLLPFPLDFSGTVLWSVEQRGLITILTLS